VATRTELLGEAGIEWLARLPGIIAACAKRWGLEIEAPYNELWYNYVAMARRGSERVVIKVCCPGHAFVQEVEALRLFNGGACVRLLGSDDELQALLLERAEPGDMVETLRDDAAEISAAAKVMLGLWRPAPQVHPFSLARDWLTAALDPAKLRRMKRRYPWITPALEHAAEMQAERHSLMLLHGDLHHGNILAAQREPWLAIDPKGVVGDVAWDVGSFLFNSLKKDPPADRPRVIRPRADQFANELSIDREWLYACSVASSLCGAFSSLRDEPNDSRNGVAAMACAGELAKGIRP
jgi:streptomycin 6-kinase